VIAPFKATLEGVIPMQDDVLAPTEKIAVTSGSECPMRLATRQFMRDPYPVLAAMRETAPAVAVENRGFRMWLLTRYEDACQVLSDPAFGKDIVLHRKKIAKQNMLRPSGMARIPHESRRSLLDRDGEDHRRLRAILRGVFTPARLAGFQSRIERIADELLDGLEAGERVDVIARYARPFPATVIGELLGVPAGEREGFPLWANELLTGTSNDEIAEGGQRLYDFALRMIDLKRREPGDDLFTRLLRTHESGVIDGDELASTYIALLIGGTEPTSTIGIGLLLLLNRPDLMMRLTRNPRLMEDCVEELVRYEPPFRLLPPRFSDRPLELDGMTIPAGELILISPALVNRDPAYFPDPDDFDLGRRPKGHLGFGHGPHYCLGAELGRLETRIGLRTFLTRFPASRLALAPDQAQWRPGTFMRRLDNLPVLLG
jgi:cytochrome P450